MKTYYCLAIVDSPMVTISVSVEGSNFAFVVLEGLVQEVVVE